MPVTYFEPGLPTSTRTVSPTHSSSQDRAIETVAQARRTSTSPPPLTHDGATEIAEHCSKPISGVRHRCCPQVSNSPSAPSSGFDRPVTCTPITRRADTLIRQFPLTPRSADGGRTGSELHPNADQGGGGGSASVPLLSSHHGAPMRLSSSDPPKGKDEAAATRWLSQ